MAGWSMLKDGHVIDISKTPPKLKPEGILVDLESVPEVCAVEVEVEVAVELETNPDRASNGNIIKGLSGKVRFCFDEFLPWFLKEVFTHKLLRPIPPMLGDGKEVDLFRLFLVVREKGGYEAVSKESLWGLVGEESGCGRGLGSAVKLLYSKYLNTLEKWMKRIQDSKVSDSILDDSRAHLNRRLMELQADIDGLLSDKEEKDEVCRPLDFICDANGMKGKTEESYGAKRVLDVGQLDTDMSGCRLNEACLGNLDDEALEIDKFNGVNISSDCHKDACLERMKRAVDVPDSGNLCNSNGVNSADRLSDGGKRCDNDDEDVLVLDPSTVNKESFRRKRKRQNMWEMLNWVTGTARNPCDPSVGPIPDKSKWKSNCNEESWKQVLLFREAAFLKRNVECSGEHIYWQSQKMHPSMYDDHLGANYNLRERLKIEKRLIFGKSPDGDLQRNPNSCTEDRYGKQSADSYTAQPGVDKCGGIPVAIGKDHQAEVPEWTGVTSESDLKWLGTRIWPSEKVNHRLLIERDPIGKGRLDSCGCQVPGSVDCVRFHIAEKSAKVRMELGVAFYDWNLDMVGEKVRCLWTMEEEGKFKDVVQSNCSPGRGFWGHIFSSFPGKNREQLVSYYFNVFLLQRRGYQNRHTPKDIDSDDESECGPLGNVFGHQAQKSHCSKLSPKKSQSRCR